ncbi:MAG: hypothetical protein Q8L97_13630 [Nitrosomonas sp.]|uniref:LPO_1073/Vpar_1526 family protein n=1 Tax=Nitrosomonas sp. TaxID=42353 RepID=UPI0027302114|nr:LPO_1073/Vpar_1526 family protein [Nitrosomonas sp.]MDP1551175.1 hypothetical protein [Nitrosomonas sp.]
MSFIIKLTEENPSGIQQFENPDFRDAVSGAQKDYAKNADKDIGDLLVNLLIERTKKENRDLAQIVLNESLRIVPKLINEHLAVLSAVFFVQNYYKEIRLDHKELQHLLDESLGKISNEIIPGYSCFRHLEFTGCGSSGKTGVRGIEQYITLRYKGLFFTGFNEAQIDKIELPNKLRKRLVTPCINDTTKLQINALNDKDLIKILEENSVDENYRTKIFTLFNENRMNHKDVKICISKFSPFMESIFYKWNNSEMRTFLPTSVGMSIAHANLKRKGFKLPDIPVLFSEEKR